MADVKRPVFVRGILVSDGLCHFYFSVDWGRYKEIQPKARRSCYILIIGGRCIVLGAVADPSKIDIRLDTEPRYAGPYDRYFCAYSTGLRCHCIVYC